MVELQRVKEQAANHEAPPTTSFKPLSSHPMTSDWTKNAIPPLINNGIPVNPPSFEMAQPPCPPITVTAHPQPAATHYQHNQQNISSSSSMIHPHASFLPSYFAPPTQLYHSGYPPPPPPPHPMYPYHPQPVFAMSQQQRNHPATTTTAANRRSSVAVDRKHRNVSPSCVMNNTNATWCTLPETDSVDDSSMQCGQFDSSAAKTNSKERRSCMNRTTSEDNLSHVETSCNSTLANKTVRQSTPAPCDNGGERVLTRRTETSTQTEVSLKELTPLVILKQAPNITAKTAESKCYTTKLNSSGASVEIPQNSVLRTRQSPAKELLSSSQDNNNADCEFKELELLSEILNQSSPHHSPAVIVARPGSGLDGLSISLIDHELQDSTVCGDEDDEQIIRDIFYIN